MKKHLLLLGGALCIACASLAQVVVPTPAQSDQIILDNNSNGKADPGDKIRYRATIQSTGTAPATGVQLNVNPDNRTTLDIASFRTSPVAAPDGPYACTGNLSISVPAASGVKINDFDDNLGGVTLAIGTQASNGTATVNNDGSFTYTPNAGFTGNDQFTYVMTDVTPVTGYTPAAGDITGTVTITVSNLIWFIDNSSAAATSDGRRTSPFKSLADFNAGSAAAAAVVYIEHTGTNYTGGIVLQNGERLFGEGHTGGANLADVLPFSLAPNSSGLPNINGTRPVLTNTSGNGVTLAQNNTLNGFDIGTCSGNGLLGSSFGTLNVANVSINTTGQAITLANGTANGTLGSVTSSGGTNNILLNGVTCNLTLGSGALSGATGRGFYINGGSGTVSYSGTIANSLDQVVHIRDWTSGTVTLSGNITATANGMVFANNTGGTINITGTSKSLTAGANSGVLMSNNTGATVNFTNGGLVISTTSGTGFAATGGGTVSVQGNGNSITTTAARALQLDGVSANATFATITAANVPTQGITLNNLSSGSSLTVPGAVSIGMASGATANVSATTCPNCTINIGTDGTTHSAVSLNSRRASGIVLTACTGAVRFGNVTANNPNSVTVPAISSTNCAGSISFASTNVDMNNAGGFEGFSAVETPQDNSGDGDAIYVNNFTGSAFTISGGTLRNSGDDGLDIRNSTNLNLSNVTVQDVGRNPGVGCVDCNSSGVQAYNVTGTVTVSNCTFLRGRLRNFFLSNPSGTTSFNVTGSTFDDTRSQGSPATDNLQIYATGSVSMAIDIENSTFTRSATKQIDVVVRGSAQVTKCDITSSTMDYVDGNSSGIFIEGLDNSRVSFNVMNNVKLHSQNENVVTISSAGTAIVQGRIKDNPNMAFNSPGSGGSVFGCVRVLSDGTTSVATILIENNAMSLTNGTDGINLSVQGASAAQINATLRGNTLNAAGTAGIPLDGINAFVNPTAGGTKTLCLTVENNTVTGIWARAARARALSTTGVTITNFVTDFATTWTAQGNSSPGLSVTQGTSGGGTIVAGSGCSQPTNPLP